jgi:hypothetical protein
MPTRKPISIPWIGVAMLAVHRLFHRNPYVAAGPIALAAADAAGVAAALSATVCPSGGSLQPAPP